MNYCEPRRIVSRTLLCHFEHRSAPWRQACKASWSFPHRRRSLLTRFKQIFLRSAFQNFKSQICPTSKLARPPGHSPAMCCSFPHRRRSLLTRFQQSFAQPAIFGRECSSSHILVGLLLLNKSESLVNLQCQVIGLAIANPGGF